jgi:RNA polymerase-interacting CarD/CdnL/TRCF family regulator
MFDIGDAVIHPDYGPGKVINIEQVSCLGPRKRYYEIELLDDTDTQIWVPVPRAEEAGLRSPVPLPRLRQMWRALGARPEPLPQDHKERYAQITPKLHSGDPIQLAEAARDLAWRRWKEGKLTKRGEDLYKEAVKRLAGEVAVIQHKEMQAAQAQISQQLNASLITLQAD